MADLVLTLENEFKQFDKLIFRIPSTFNEQVKEYYIKEFKKKGETLNLIIDKSNFTND
jgi:hypothetical protein